MRILLWAPLGAGTHYWGPGTSAFRLYNRGLPCRYSVSLAHGCTEQEDFKQVYSQQFKIYTINRNNPFTQLCFIYKGNYWLKKNHANFDVFHGIGAFQTTFGPAIRWAKFGKPSFLKVTGSSGGVEDSSFYSKMLGFSRQRERQANMIKGYIAISTDIREKLINFGVHPEKVHLIPNGVDTRIFRPAELEEKLRLRRNLNIPNISTFIFVGGLTPNKQQFKCVQAIHRLINIGYNVQLILLGPDRSKGEELDKIEGYLSKYPSLRSRILHVSFSATPELYYRCADYFILTSKKEGMPNALLEAMATRLPCLVTPTSGSTDLVIDKVSGLLVNDTIDEITESCKHMLDSPEAAQKMALEAFSLIIKEYSSEIVLDKHLKLFEAYGRF